MVRLTELLAETHKLLAPSALPKARKRELYPKQLGANILNPAAPLKVPTHKISDPSETPDFIHWMVSKLRRPTTAQQRQESLDSAVSALLKESRSVLESYQPKPRPMGTLAKDWKGPEWRRPSLKKERGELVRSAKDLGVKTAEIYAAAKRSEVAPITKKDWARLDNTWSWGVSKKKHHDWAQEIGRDTAKIDKGFKEGHRLPAPIVIHRKGKRPYLAAGNTRLSAAYVHGVTPHVLHVHLDSKKT